MTDAPAGNGSAPKDEAWTKIDMAFERAQADAEETAAFFDALFNSTLFLPVHDDFDESGEGVAGEDTSISPIYFEIEGEPVLLVFDSEDRLARWATEPMNYVGLPGVAVFQMFTGAEKIGVNIGVAPSSVVLDQENVAWLHEQAMRMIDAEEIDAGAQLAIEAPSGASREAVAAATSAVAGVRADVEEAILFRLSEGNEGANPRLVLGLAPTVAGIARAEEVAQQVASAAKQLAAGAEPLEVAVLDGNGELMNKAREVGLRLPIIDLSSMN